MRFVGVGGMKPPLRQRALTSASPGKAYLLAGRKGVSSEELLYRVIYIEAVEAGLQEPLGKRGGAVVQPTEGSAFPRSHN